MRNKKNNKNKYMITPYPPFIPPPPGFYYIQPPKKIKKPNNKPNNPEPTPPDKKPEVPDKNKKVDLNFLNGWLRTQIGKYMRIDFIVSNQLTDKSGILVGVGKDYVLLKDVVSAVLYSGEFSAIKFVRVLE